jgi:type VI secretion system protein VasG
VESASRELKALQAGHPLVPTEVDPDMIAKVVSDWTGIPLGKVLRDEAGDIGQLEKNLSKRIKGQDAAVARICETLRASKVGLKEPQQPLGVFLLVGPSGVGKTETAQVIADLLFGGERFLHTINMSEFHESHSVSRLIGSPPGYVGYGEGGLLTEAVRQRPYSAVLIDEVEKGHLDVMNLFYQVFDKGILADGEGRRVDFKNTVLFLTSNLASETILRLCADGTPPIEQLLEAIRPALSRHFKPALLARMIVVPYSPLNTESLKTIVGLKLDRLAARLFETHKIKLTYSAAVADQLAARCLEVETGARNIDHLLNRTLLPQLSRKIVVGLGKHEMPSELHLELNADGLFSWRTLVDAQAMVAGSSEIGLNK